MFFNQVTHSISDDNDCDIPPPLGVEPLTCCRISKPFDRKNFPECFIEPPIPPTGQYPQIPVDEDGFIDDGPGPGPTGPPPPPPPPSRGYINRGYGGYKGYAKGHQDIDAKKYKQFIIAHWPSKYHWGFDSHTPITTGRGDYRPYSSSSGNGRYRRSPIYRPIIPPIVSNFMFNLKFKSY